MASQSLSYLPIKLEVAGIKFVSSGGAQRRSGRKHAPNSWGWKPGKCTNYATAAQTVLETAETVSRQWRSLGREKMRGSCTENIICALGCGLGTGPQVRDSKHALCQAADGPRSATGSNFAAGVQVSPQDFQTQDVIINSRNGYNFFTSILPYCERKVLC